MVESKADQDEVPKGMIPDQAYLYFPGVNDQKTPDGIRRIFSGNVKFDENEMKMITKFKEHCRKQSHSLQSNWDDARLLRFLQANHWKIDKTLNAIRDNDASRRERIPAQKTPFLEKFLHEGIMYIHGRDRMYRPIVVFNAYMIDPKKAEADDLINGLTYFFEFLINHILLPGQVENWIFILDLNNVGIGSLPKTAMKKIISYLQANYRGHLTTMNIINTPSSIYIPWALIKGFLDEVTVKKIQFFKTGSPTTLFDSTNREQVEQKFGGTAPNLSRFWPPTFPSDKYLLPSDDPEKRLLTQHEYTKRFKLGLLAGHRINESLLLKEEFEDPTSPLKELKNDTNKLTEILKPQHTHSLPAKRNDARAFTVGDPKIKEIGFSKDDLDADIEEDFNIHFIDEEIKLKPTMSANHRVPKRNHTYFNADARVFSFDLNPQIVKQDP